MLSYSWLPSAVSRHVSSARDAPSSRGNLSSTPRTGHPSASADILPLGARVHKKTAYPIKDKRLIRPVKRLPTANLSPYRFCIMASASYQSLGLFLPYMENKKVYSPSPAGNRLAVLLSESHYSFLRYNNMPRILLS